MRRSGVARARWEERFLLFPDVSRYENEITAVGGAGRLWNALRGGYPPPPREKRLPPRPEDGLCECCGEFTEGFHLDHCHETGAFRGWVCRACNTGAGIMDDIERLEKRITFLKAHKKKERIALIKAVHTAM